MNFYSDIKYINLPIILGGPIEIKGGEEGFPYIIYNNLDVGSTYTLKLLHNGINLTMYGEDVSTLVLTIPEPSKKFPIISLYRTYQE
jgi:hypothetical protein